MPSLKQELAVLNQRLERLDAIEKKSDEIIAANADLRQINTELSRSNAALMDENVQFKTKYDTLEKSVEKLTDFVNRQTEIR